MKKILAITVNTKPIRYVMSTSNRFDGKKLAELTDNKNHAYDFSTMDKACAVIDLIVNPFERVFTAEHIEVENSTYRASMDEIFN